MCKGNNTTIKCELIELKAEVRQLHTMVQAITEQLHTLSQLVAERSVDATESRIAVQQAELSGDSN